MAARLTLRDLRDLRGFVAKSKLKKAEIKIPDFFCAIKKNLQVYRKSRGSTLLKFSSDCLILVFATKFLRDFKKCQNSF